MSDINWRVIFVTGSREWTDEWAMRSALHHHMPGAWLLHGGCKGADLMAEKLAHEYGFQPIRMDALWEKLGKPAGAIRNRQMGRLLATLRDAGAQVYPYVFHNDLAKSKGTRDMTRVLQVHGFTWSHPPSRSTPEKEEKTNEVAG